MRNMSYARALSPALSIAEIMAYSPASGSDSGINGAPFGEVEVIVDEKTAQILNDSLPRPPSRLYRSDSCLNKKSLGRRN